MTRTLTLVAIACAAGLDYRSAVILVTELVPSLPDDDIDAGRVIADAVGDLITPV